MPRAPKRAELLLRNVLPHADLDLAGDARVTRVCSDPHRCRPGDTYVPLLEANVDGHDLADLAVANGASLVVAEQYVPVSVPMAIVSDTREALGRLSHALAGEPSQRIRTVAIAGSAGKTVMTMLLASVLEKAGRHVGVTSSIGYSDSITQKAARATTPKAPRLAKWLSRMVVNGCDDALVEISTKALAERRLAGMKFDGFIVHNLLSFSDASRNPSLSLPLINRNLLSLAKQGAIVCVNADDPALASLISQAKLPLLTYGQVAEADVTAKLLERHGSEQTFMIFAGNDAIPVRTHMIGSEHISNCLAVTALALSMGIDLATIVQGLEAVAFVPGRMERVEAGQPFRVFVDRAASPESLAQTLKTIRQASTGRVICVLGCAGHIPKEMRAAIGRIAERGCDVPIITCDNPGLQCPEAIVHDMLDGFDRPAKARHRHGRREAIRWALSIARPGDTVVVTYNGRLGYQNRDGVVAPFDEVATAFELLRQPPAGTTGPANRRLRIVG